MEGRQQECASQKVLPRRVEALHACEGPAHVRGGRKGFGGQRADGVGVEGVLLLCRLEGRQHLRLVAELRVRVVPVEARPQVILPRRGVDGHGARGEGANNASQHLDADVSHTIPTVQQARG